jgi:hypothetical protein
MEATPNPSTATSATARQMAKSLSAFMWSTPGPLCTHARENASNKKSSVRMNRRSKLRNVSAIPITRSCLPQALRRRFTGPRLNDARMLLLQIVVAGNETEVRHPIFARMHARKSGKAEAKGQAEHREEALRGSSGMG